MAEPLRVLLVASEATPFAKTGGLGDMVGALAPALRQRGLDVRLLLPRYGWIRRDGLSQHPRPLSVPAGGSERWSALLQGQLAGVPVYFLEHNVAFDRSGVYGPPGGAYEDNCFRFALLSRGALQLCAHLNWWPQVFHAHDWPTALVPVFLNTVGRGTPTGAAASVLTIHNLAHQGWFDRSRFAETGLEVGFHQHLGLEGNDGINLLKGGIYHSTVISTVSPTYAQEIQTPSYGEGLDALLRSRQSDLFGVLNGIDEEVWNPATDPHLPHRYGAEDLAGKRACKAALQQEAGLPQRPEVPLLGLVSRLAAQKGIDLLLAGIDRLLELDLQLVVLGTGDPSAEQLLAQLSARRRDRVHAWIGFDERLAHLIEAGSDFFLMPSRWEPCGLNQMYSHRYGTVPIVRATGGLEDTVQNFDSATGEGTGFKFRDATSEALLGAIQAALRVYREDRLGMATLVRRVMAERHGWDRAAAAYEYLYRLALVRKHRG